jgi:NADPH:quinone reductase-like Zn-dependent oxidoreductase
LRSGVLKDVVRLTFPAILGFDVSGVVEAVGPGVESFGRGDRVFAQATQTYASLCLVNATDLARIPAHMGKATGADRVVALDDERSITSFESVDAVADTVSGPTADKLTGKVKIEMAEAVRAGKLTIPIGQRFALAEANKAHRAAEKGASGKLLLIA